MLTEHKNEKFWPNLQEKFQVMKKMLEPLKS